MPQDKASYSIAFIFKTNTIEVVELKKAGHYQSKVTLNNNSTFFIKAPEL